MEIGNEQIREEYIKLSDTVQKWNDKPKKNGELTICPAIAGSKYQEGGVMFVGRAINGWCPLHKNSNNVYDNQLRHCESIGLNWVKGGSDWLERCRCCMFGKTYYGKEDAIEGTKSHMSPFWQMVKYICEKEGIGDNWLDRIVWSNLYKASYVEGGNPTSFYANQIEVCNELLKLEIEKYTPRAIYFITEAYREHPSANNRTWFCKTYKDSHGKESKINFAAVYAYLQQHRKIKVSVLMRPEFRNKNELWALRQDLDGNTIAD